MKTVSIILSDDEYYKLEKMASENFIDIDEYIREKIREILSESGTDFLSQ